MFLITPYTAAKVYYRCDSLVNIVPCSDICLPLCMRFQGGGILFFFAHGKFIALQLTVGSYAWVRQQQSETQSEVKSSSQGYTVFSSHAASHALNHLRCNAQ